MRERILVVEDEEPIREIIVSMLAAENYQCRQAGSGMEALAILDSGEQFDLISSDLMMCNLDGIGLLEQVKVRYPEVPFVLVTAVHDVHVALAALRFGAFDYLLMPFERQDLLVMTRRALENYRLRRDSGSNTTTLEYLVAALTTELRSKVSKLNFSDEEAIIDALSLRDVPDFFRIVAIGKAMGLADSQIEAMTRAASLHYVSQAPALLNILLQPERLLPDELAVMCKQCHAIHEIFRSIPCLADASENMFASYECFDGTGHPRGLKGDAIPLGARILGVAYFIYHLTSRTYPQMSPASVRSEIQRWSGRRFDPEVVKAVVSIPDATWKRN